MKFIITLNTDNAAFEGNPSEARREIRRVLAEAADQIAYCPTGLAVGRVRDSNGNTVCTWTSEED